MTLTFRWIIFACLSLGCLTSCTIAFNFTGGSVDDSLETLSVETFGNEAPLVVPFLALEVTNQIQDRFLSQSRLTLTDGAADVQLSGAVVRYAVTPVAVQGDETASQNRLTIDVRVAFENTQNPSDSWTQNFSSFTDFDANLDLASEEARLIDEVLEQITQDIFTKSIGKW